MADDNPQFPAWYYGPAGASGIFQNLGEVPEGWAATPGGEAVDPPVDPLDDETLPPLTRKQIMADLSERKVAFSPTLKTTVLYEMLLAEIEKTS